MPRKGPQHPKSCYELTRIELKKESRGVLALGFSPNGRYLAAVTSDDNHTVFVWDWQANSHKPLCDGIGSKGKPPQVRK